MCGEFEQMATVGWSAVQLMIGTLIGLMIYVACSKGDHDVDD